MERNRTITGKDLKLCFGLAAAIFVLACAALFLPAPWADWRFSAALFILQIVLAAPLVYFARPFLNSGRRSLFGGVPQMPGLLFAAWIVALCAAIGAGLSIAWQGAGVAALLIAPLAVNLLLVFIDGYVKNSSGITAPEEADATAAFVLPAVFVMALVAALSWWFYGLGAAAAWQAAGAVLLAAGAGVFMLGQSLPLYYALHNAKQNGYAFNDAASAEECRRLTMAVFDEALAKGTAQEITDIVTTTISEAQLLVLATAVSQVAQLPQAGLFAAQAQGLPLPVCSGAVKMRGGVSVQCAGKNIRMGTLDFVRTVASVPTQFAAMQHSFAAQGKDVFVLTSGRKLLGLIAVGQGVNAEAGAAVQALQRLGVRTVMFTSGTKAAAEYTAAKAGFSRTVAELAEAHQRELADAFCRTGEFLAVLKPAPGGAAAVFYSPAGTQAGGLLVQSLDNLAQAVVLSGRLNAVRKQNNKIALWLGALWAVLAACGWVLLFKALLPGAALALMLVISALAVWLSSRRLKG